MKPLCIYHAGCNDGFTAAYLLNSVVDVELHPGVYNEPPPDVYDREVYILDFSYSKEDTVKMLSEANSVVVIDHHKTAKERLGGIRAKNFTFIYDEGKCGAMLTMEYLEKKEKKIFTEKTKQIVSHVDDYGRQVKQFTDTDVVVAYMYSFDQTIDNWDKIFNQNMETIVWDGQAILRAKEKEARSLVENLYELICFTTESGANFSVPEINCNAMYSSLVGNMLLERYKKEYDEYPPFSITWYQNKREAVYSLRSNEHGIDVSEIAKEFGGGGHKHAAGFKIPFA